MGRAIAVDGSGEGDRTLVDGEKAKIVDPSSSDSLSAMPPLPDDWAMIKSPQSNVILPIAIALAIAIPISLLIGAIAGFLIGR